MRSELHEIECQQQEKNKITSYVRHHHNEIKCPQPLEKDYYLEIQKEGITVQQFQLFS